MSPLSGPPDSDSDVVSVGEPVALSLVDSLAEEPEVALSPEAEPESSLPQPARTSEPRTTVAVRRASLFTASPRYGVTGGKLPGGPWANPLGPVGTRMTWWGPGRPRRLHDGRERGQRRPEGEDARGARAEEQGQPPQ